MFAAEGSAELVEFDGALIGHDKLLRVETVLEGVLGRAGFAFGGAGTGRELGIAAIAFGAGQFGGSGWFGETHGSDLPDGNTAQERTGSRGVSDCVLAGKEMCAGW